MKDNSGPAFPRDSYKDLETGLVVMQNGMTLRDWFAGQALSSLAFEYCNSPTTAARLSYELSDAMLKERTK